jgi:hypothetical protein
MKFLSRLGKWESLLFLLLLSALAYLPNIRHFGFDSARKATNLGAQLKLLIDSPLLVGVG